MGLINLAAIPMYKTIKDYGTNVSDVNKFLYAVKDSAAFFNPFFMILFGIFMVFTIASYYAQIKLVGNQRFFNSLLAGSFSTFLISMLFSFSELVTPLDVMFFVAIAVISFAVLWFYRD